MVLLIRLALLIDLLAIVSAYVLIDDTVDALTKQLQSLDERKEIDFELLISLLKSTLRKTIDVNSLYSDVKNLQEDVNFIRLEQATTCGCANMKKNQEETLKWLSNSMVEVKAEVLELAKAYNLSDEGQQLRTLKTHIAIVQEDIAGLKEDLEMLKKVNGELKPFTYRTDYRKVKQQMENGPKKLVQKRMVVTNEDPLIMKTETKIISDEDKQQEHSSKQRHFGRKYIQSEIEKIKSSLQEVELAQIHLKHQLRPVQRKISVVDDLRKTVVGLAQFSEKRISQVEKDNKSLFESLTNLTEQVGSQDKLRVSTLQLLESLENLESKVDTTTPDLRHEISKLEFTLTQTTSTAALLKEDLDNQRITLKAMGESLSLMQDKFHDQQNELNVLKNNVTRTTETSRTEISIVADDSASNSVEVNQPASSLNFTNSMQRTYYRLENLCTGYENIIKQLPIGCEEINGPDGLYIISPDTYGVPILVKCEFDKVNNLAFTVFQRRSNGTLNFNKNWEQYATGFGSPTGEFWLGNEALHRLTENKYGAELKVEFLDVNNQAWYAQYTNFAVGSRNSGYQLNISGYKGNASDALIYHNKMQFSTVDSDRDISNTNCAENYEGGWWYTHCQHVNFNGKYKLGLSWFDTAKNEWRHIVKTTMKLFRPMAAITTEF